MRVVDFYCLFLFFRPQGTGRHAEIGTAEMGKVGKGFETIFVADLGYGHFGCGQVSLDVFAFLFQHPLVNRFAESLFEQAAESRRTVTSQLCKCFHVFRFHIVLHNEITETLAVSVDRGVESGKFF